MQITPDGSITVEAGSPRVILPATDENLSNAVSPARYEAGGLGSDGQPIVKGQPFEFLDDSAPDVFKVYQRTVCDETRKGEPIKVERMVPVAGPFETQEEAIQAAVAIAQGE